jgi:hypothetical protein
MIERKKVISKVTMATGVFAMGLGLVSSMSFESKAVVSTSCADYCQTDPEYTCKLTYADGKVIYCNEQRKK